VSRHCSSRAQEKPWEWHPAGPLPYIETAGNEKEIKDFLDNAKKKIGPWDHNLDVKADSMGETKVVSMTPKRPPKQ
jgi:hypothetical protein